MILGRVDEVDGHFVATKFVAGAFPSKSLYIAEETGRGRVATPIRMHWKSVAASYARLHFPILAVAIPLLASGNLSAHVWLTSAVLLTASFLFVLPSQPSAREKERLRMLGSITGFRLHPAKLLPETRASKRDRILELMNKGGLPVSPDGILSVLDDIPGPALPLVYVFARYAGDEPEWQLVAERVYERHELGVF